MLEMHQRAELTMNNMQSTNQLSKTVEEKDKDEMARDDDRHRVKILEIQPMYNEYS